jgi:hypothetical protein
VMTDASTATGTFPLTITGMSGSLPARDTPATLVVGSDCSNAQGECQR